MGISSESFLVYILKSISVQLGAKCNVTCKILVLYHIWPEQHITLLSVYLWKYHAARLSLRSISVLRLVDITSQRKHQLIKRLLYNCCPFFIYYSMSIVMPWLKINCAIFQCQQPFQRSLIHIHYWYNSFSCRLL